MNYLLSWCDVAFFDFCHFPLNYVGKLESLDCKVIVRTHGVEIYEWFKEIDWNKIDKIICSRPQYMRIESKYSHLIDKTEILPIGIDLDTFNYKDKSYGKNICMINFIAPRKRVYTTIETLLPLLRTGWRLHVRGKVSEVYRPQAGNEYAEFINELLEQYNLIQDENVLFYPTYMKKELFVAWLQDKDIIINNSTQEGYGKSIFDAMACGIFPLVHNWYGADTLFRDIHLFNTQEELVKKIQWWENLTDKDKKYHSKESRLFVESGHDEREVAIAIRKVIETV